MKHYQYLRESLLISQKIAVMLARAHLVYSEKKGGLQNPPKRFCRFPKASKVSKKG